jgi:hypothetical protein
VLLVGRFYYWTEEEFANERGELRNLIERLLQLLFLIRVHYFNFSFSLYEFLAKFRVSIPHSMLSNQWHEVINEQILQYDNVSPCANFINMLQADNEPFVVLNRYGMLLCAY